MEIRYNVTGAKRKELVKVIANATAPGRNTSSCPPAIMRLIISRSPRMGRSYLTTVPTARKSSGCWKPSPPPALNVSRRTAVSSSGGTKEAAEAADSAPQVANLRGPRQTNRFVGERTSSEVNELSASDGSERYGACEDTLTVEIPLDKVAVGNLTKLLDAKGNLIRKALGITDLRIEVLEDRVAFPWFSQVDTDSAAAYTHFISALCEMSRNAKRVTATEKPVDNEKYAFRCFLLRLGFIGSEYKMERKILLKNLTRFLGLQERGCEP